jgi:tetratricopeptide (TPR) repeat protein
MAHVISLQMSNNRVPRWISEGMSDFEERRARPEWGHERMLAFVQAFDAGKLLKLENIGDGLLDPRMTSIVYAHASLVVEHLVELYGEPAMGRMLRAFGKGLETEAAFKEAFNASLDDVQRTFDSWLERKFAPIRAGLKGPEIPENATLEQLKALATANPDSFAVQMTLGRQLYEAGDLPGSIQALERAAKMVPIASGDANPNAMIAAVATKQGDTARAIQALEAVVQIDSSDVEAARQLATLLEPTGNAARTAAAYARVAELDPFDAKAQTVVGRHALRQKNADVAIRSFRAVVASSPADRATAHADLAEAYLLSGSLADAKREALTALEIAPSFERAQDVLLQTVAPSGGGGGAP